MSLLLDLGEGKGDGRRVPVRGQGIDPGAARVAQPQQFGDLVEGFAGCIVERGANVTVGKALPLMTGQIKMGVAAGDDQGQRSSADRWNRLAHRFTLRQ